ncbi:RNA exonuclease 1 homolog isoform X2 [Ixodes scapularis]|uniref:RNA exonuclease 1 homolog isoform X2 n=1 Tax=Ixodes scapularis TaxID=6945 RepID=UPI001A9DDA8B|nr:RNA exonuclease 1 homolog isoform X2 [Ixodes scapularis]
MLPSSGYFKSIICPFYASGLCERPHCHFRHVKKDAGRPSAALEQGTVPASSEDQSQLLQCVNDALQKVQQDMVAVSKLGSTPQAVAYVPTPVGKCPTRRPAVPEQKRYIPAQSVPEYRPTPLSELRRRRAGVLGAAQRASPPLAKKRREEGSSTPLATAPTTIPTIPSCKSSAPTVKSETSDPCQSNGKTPADEDDDSESQDAGFPLVREEEDAIIKMKNKRNLQASIDTPSHLSKGTLQPPVADDTSLPSKDTKDIPSKTSSLPPSPVDDASVMSQDPTSTANDALPPPKDTTPPLEDPILVKNKEPPESSALSASAESKDADGTKEDGQSKAHLDAKSVSKNSSSRSRHSSSKEKSKHASSKSSRHRSSHSSHRSSSSKGHSSTKDKTAGASKSSTDKNEKKEKSDSEKTATDKRSSLDNHKDGKSHGGSSTKTKSSSSRSSSKHHKSSHHKSSTSSSKRSHSSHGSSSRKDSSADKKKSKSRRSSDGKEASESKAKDGSVCNGSADESVLRPADEDVSKDNGDGVDSRFSLEWELDSDDDETYEECLRIFNEVQAVGDQPVSALQKKKTQTSCEPAVPTKQRVAHDPDLTRRQDAQRGLSAHISAAQAMHNRFAQLQKRYQDQASNGHQPGAFVSSVMKAQEGSQKRIAHVPNAPLLAAARKNATVVTNTFTVASQPKGQRRLAHVPALVLSKRPTIPAEYGSRVPVVVRQRYLNLFVDECAKSSTTEEEAIEKALSEEKQTYERSSNKSVYLNVAVNTLKRLRREAAAQAEAASVGETSTSAPDLRPQGANKVVSHALVLQGALGARTSFSIEKNRYKKPAVELTASRLYSLLEPYHLTPEQLEEHNYPLPHPMEPGRAVFKGVSDGRKYSKHGEPTLHCSRCGASFSLTKEGSYVRPEECVHHWGRLWKKRIAGSLESRYSCCEGDSQSDGCCVAKGHVHEGYDPSTLTGFVRTLAKSPLRGGNPGVYALDCEMCYTTEGVELTRVTVVGWDLRPVYETLVKPANPILDYNTRFSGITEEDMDRVQTTIRDVQAVLLSLFSDQTVLLGHSLDSDLKALRLVHSCVVDTAVVFPHRRGLPYKRALRTLMAEHLNKIIQNGVDGHDSQEDAVACMELMIWKVKEDLKRNR